MFKRHAIYIKGDPNAVTDELWELTDYVVEFDNELTDAEKKQVTRDYGAVLQPLHGAYYLLNYANFVGLTSFCGRRYKVLSRKLSENDIDGMNRFISSRMASLPYYSHNPVQTYWTENASGEAQKLHQWYYLRTALLGEWEGSPLPEWWLLIDRDPHHRIESVIVDSPAWSFRNAGPDSMEEIVRRPETWVPLPDGSSLSHTALAQKLTMGGRSYFPGAVRQRVNQLTYDTAENRMMRNIVQQFVELTEWMEARIRNRTFYNRTEVENDNRTMHELLSGLLLSAWIQETSELVSPPRASTVLQRKVGYRQWYSFYQHWLLGGQFPMPEDLVRTLVDTKDIAKIYEYWCFFMVVDVVEKQFGMKPSSMNETRDWDEQGQLVNGLRVTFPDQEQNLLVYYNKCFSGGKESYSQTYKPDISLSWRGVWHHFDAKFKVAADAKGAKAAKKEDLDKMHTYRDAIGGTGTVWVLYPADQEQQPLFYPVNGDPSFAGGVGSIALTPGNLTGLGKVIEQLLNLG